MSWSAVAESYWGRCASAVALLATSFVLLPLVALAVPVLPGTVGRWLFYWPQYALLPGGLRAVAGTGAQGAGTATIVAGLIWLALIGAFVGATWRWRARAVLVALLPAAVVLTALAMMLLGLLGWVPVLDGP